MKNHSKESLWKGKINKMKHIQILMHKKCPIYVLQCRPRSVRSPQFFFGFSENHWDFFKSPAFPSIFIILKFYQLFKNFKLTKNSEKSPNFLKILSQYSNR
jgi:hypothetical protein